MNYLTTYMTRSGFCAFGNAPINGIDTSKLKSCLVSSTLDHYGLTGSTLLSGALSIPISKAIVPPYRVIGTPTTNLLSVVGQYAEINVPRVVIAGRGSTNLFRIAGRANPFISTALAATDVAAIGAGTYNCYNANAGGIGQGGASGGAGASGDW